MPIGDHFDRMTDRMPGLGREDIMRFCDLARDRGFQVRFIEFMPLDGDRAWRAEEVLTGAEVRAMVEAVHPLVEREREPHAAAKLKAMLSASPPEGYIACCEALSTLDQRALLPRIKSPTLDIAGRHDKSTPIAGAEYIRSQIPDASLTILDAAHISNVEQSHAFTEAVAGFLMQR